MNRTLIIRNLFYKIILAVVTFGLMSCEKSRVDQPQWYKGNLHTHSYWSDGDEFPEMIMKWYKSNGYHFVALSDHNILAKGEKWKVIPEKEILRKGFTEYLEEYGEEWVNYHEDTAGLKVKLKTFEEYKPLFEEEGRFLIIQSEEITTGFDNKPVHLNATNIQELIMPKGGNSVAEVLQNNIDAVLQQREETGKPIMPHINHPNFHYGISAEDMIELEGERFFEVYNGHPAVNNYGDSMHIGMEEMWDMINIAYRNRNQPLLYGLATDDSHNYHEFGSKFSNAGRGWVMVKADSLNPGSLIRAMEQGDFYATTGVELNEVIFRDNVLRVDVKEEQGVNYEIRFIGVFDQQSEAEVLDSVKEEYAEFELTEDLLFVRAKIISDKRKVNPYREGEYEVAWTQPVIYNQ